jgi:hypothetical protein
VLLENVNEIMEMAKVQKESMEKEGCTFRKDKLKDERPRSWYETGLRYLGHYRLYKCEGWEFHDVEKEFEKASKKMNASLTFALVGDDRIPKDAELIAD